MVDWRQLRRWGIPLTRLPPASIIRSGASAFVLKALAADELVTAIDEVLAGRVYVTPAVDR